jgi:hypothetical protein
MSYVSDPSTYGRLAREALFARLPRAITAYLASCVIVPDEAMAATRASVYPTDPGGIGGPNGRQPVGYWFKLAGRLSSALAFAQTSGLAGDERAARLIARTWFSEPRSSTPKASRSAWLGFEVPWSWGIHHIGGFYPLLGSDLALVSNDGLYGFAIDTYVGYLEWEYDDGETVYRVARWYPSSAVPQLRR